MEPTPTVRKRPKQACKNCRRKKARCPGERPSCSFCTRLKQHCEYDEPAAPRKIAKSTGQTKTARLAERVADLESKLQSLSSLKEDNSDVPPEYCPTGFLQSPTFETDTRSRSPPQDSLTSTEKSFDGDDDTPKFQRIPPTHVVVAATDAYFLVCHSRPCTFFFRDKFQRELENGLLPSYLLRAIVASTTHLLLDPWFDNKQLEATQTMAQLAWIEALNEAMSGISLNTVAILQTMGLLILLDLRTSSYSSAVTKLRMAVSVAESSGMNKEPDDQLSILQQEERRYVFWSLYVIDKVSALVLGNAPLLADHSCFLRLPEEQKLFRKSQQNNMTNLSAAKDSYSTRGGFSKLIVACSLVGQLAALSQDDTLYRGRFGGSLLELHKTLAAQIRRLGSMLSEEEGSTSATSGVEGRVQMMYARSMFHCIGIFINHPFFVKRYIPTNQRSPQVCIRTNQQCREHAERLGDWLRSAKSYDAVPHNQLFPGYAIFNACLVFCLFMNSPDRVVAAKSREQYEKLKILLYQQAVSGNSTDPDYYIRTLDHFASRPGAAGLLADASNTYIPTSRSPGLWHFLDFSWLDDHFSFGPKQDSQRKNSKENKEDDCLAMSYAMSSSADTQFPCFNTSPSDNPNSNIDQRMAPVQHASQRSSLEKSLPTWTNPKVSASEMQHYGFTTMQGNEFQDNTGMPTPSQSPPFINVNNYQQIYGSMDGNTESFGNWVASAYSRWDDDTMQDLGNQGNSAGEIRLLYG